jgi:hypothetical protein
VSVKDAGKGAAAGALIGLLLPVFGPATPVVTGFGGAVWSLIFGH